MKSNKIVGVRSLFREVQAEYCMLTLTFQIRKLTTKNSLATNALNNRVRGPSEDLRTLVDSRCTQHMGLNSISFLYWHFMETQLFKSVHVGQLFTWNKFISLTMRCSQAAWVCGRLLRNNGRWPALLLSLKDLWISCVKRKGLCSQVFLAKLRPGYEK